MRIYCQTSRSLKRVSDHGCEKVDNKHESEDRDGCSKRCDPFSQEMKNTGWDEQKIQMSNKRTRFLALWSAGIGE